MTHCVPSGNQVQEEPKQVSSVGPGSVAERAKGSRQRWPCVSRVCFEFCINLTVLHDTFIYSQPLVYLIWREYDFTSRDTIYLVYWTVKYMYEIKLVPFGLLVY